jgi:hypothetical protein
MHKPMLRILGAAAAISVCLAVGSAASAAMITFAASFEYSGGVAPEGTPPWLTATFDDGGSPGSVDLTLETTNLTDNESVFVWMFNLDPDLAPNDLVFSAPVKTGAFTDPTINLGVDEFKADGDGYFDIKFDFDQSDGAPTRFGVGDAAEYTITGIPTLTAYSFDFISAPDGAPGEFPMAAHVAAIGPNSYSGWVSVPEPSCFLLLAAGVLGMTRRKHR